MNKRLLSMLLVLCMVVTMMPISAIAELLPEGRLAQTSTLQERSRSRCH